MKKNLRELVCYLKGALFTGLFILFVLGPVIGFVYSVIIILLGGTVNFFNLVGLMFMFYLGYVLVSLIIACYFITHKKFFKILLREGYCKNLVRFLAIIKWE